MMSVPAINSVLPSSGNQPAKINSSPTASTSPLGISVPPKISVIPPAQVPSSPSKPSLGVNYSQVPLSLVFENKVGNSQAQPSIPKQAIEKPKDLSPAKPTPNGVETLDEKTSNTHQIQATPSLTSKTEETSEPKTTVNHTEEKSEIKNEVPPKVDEVAPSSGSIPVVTEKVETNQTENTSKGEVNSEKEVKENKETQQLNETPTKAEKSAEKVDENKAPTSTPSTSQTNKRKREQKPEKDKKDEEQEPEKKTRRIRSQVLPYQSPLPELATFLNKSLKEKDASQKPNEDKLIVFYKNEFLAVRNAEGGFYLCQTLQNVYRSSHRIRIRWLSQKKSGSEEESQKKTSSEEDPEKKTGSEEEPEKKESPVDNSTKKDGDIYTPDFYDLTDFECILTTVALTKMEKSMYKLRKEELERIENILKRALDVEKGVTEKPSITEEHPDGIDLSLYKDESQLQKPKKAPKRKASTPTKSPKQAKKSKPSEPTKKPPTTNVSNVSKKSSKAGKKVTSPKKTKGKGKKGKSESKKSKAVDQLKESPPNEKARVVAKVLRKVDIVPVKEVSTKKTKSKAAKKSTASSKIQKKKEQKSGKKTPQETGKNDAHHERRKGKNKYSSNKSKKN